ncbi:potassium channel protein [Synechococcus sp. CCY9201]|uniref:potassium channel family protein n=1 Tax=unclassified Synechococcus TaxID=2626047 RepID=UPI0018CCA7CC|nr:MULTISPECIES: potassium channel protein [unclassified Synechococcus]MEA5423381.1 potassium channel protein [Synechococcus sp. CCY9202]MEA5473539.1 potassium channel protein [Synechococcus sp. CCY9201]QPN58613.1 potassium channel protein [Synechococcus sp. CBW1002]QPN65352.1 potassium channel protein [Synechococcus sp. CBW1006]
MIPALRRRRRPPSTRLRRPWRTPMVALAIVVNLSALGYRLTEGWDWGDCYWMVAITISTIGYGEVEPLSPGGRLVTALSIIGGLIVVQLTIQGVLGLTESGYFRRMRQRRFLRWIETMQNHVILCGYGRIGREIAEQISSEGVSLLVVEMDEERKREAEERGLPVLSADATLDETLVEAGIHRCRSLVAALPSNAANLYVVLSARGLAPGCRLIARSDSEEAERKLRLAGADQVVSPYVAGGRTMAATALRPLAVSFMDLLAGSNCEVEEFQLSSDPRLLGDLSGRTLAELTLRRRTGALVLAIRNPEPPSQPIPTYRGAPVLPSPVTLIANPDGDVRLGPGQLLVALGSKEQLRALADLLGPALEAVETMQE